MGSDQRPSSYDFPSQRVCPNYLPPSCRVPSTTCWHGTVSRASPFFSLQSLYDERRYASLFFGENVIMSVWLPSVQCLSTSPRCPRTSVYSTSLGVKAFCVVKALEVTAVNQSKTFLQDPTGSDPIGSFSGFIITP